MRKKIQSESKDDESLTSPRNSTPVVNPFSQYSYQSPSRREKRQVAVRAEESTYQPPASSSQKSLRLSSSPHKSTSTLGKRTLVDDDASVPTESRDAEQSDVGSRSPTKSKKVKVYEHLRPLSDYLAPELDIVFCGINPGEQSALIGHHFANPTNHFWSCLHQSGLTSRKLDPREDYKLPTEYRLGMTNLVKRPTVEQSELSRQEQLDGVPELLNKIYQYKPYVVCFVGLGIAEIVRSKVTTIRGKMVQQVKKMGTGTPKAKAEVGLQTYKIIHRGSHETIFYAVSSTSGRVVKYQKSDKIEQFKSLQELSLNVKAGTFDSTDLIPLQSFSGLCERTVDSKMSR